MLTDEIRYNWNATHRGYASEILSLKRTGTPAWTVTLSGEYGVAIPFPGDHTISERFANARIYSSEARFEDYGNERLLFLTTASKRIEAPFSSLCAEFIEPGTNGEFRKEIQADPSGWWSKWKELLGNRNIDSAVYDTLGELCAVRHLYQKGLVPNWNGPNSSTYDIECAREFYEVKSSIVRDRKEITISSQFQADIRGKILHLIYCQLEPSVKNGISVNGIVDELASLGANKNNLNQKLRIKGLEEGKSIRGKTYLLHTMLQYEFNEYFPAITPDSFVGGVMPKGITKYAYTVSLDGLASERLI